jgi:hypothetical protein
MTDPIAHLAAQLGTLASQLAVRGDVADTAEPARALYNIAGALGCLVAPVGKLCERAAEDADPATAAELAGVTEALRAAERAVRTAQKAFR